MRSIRANPFVVLADVTIALCFIFAVYAVASTALNSQLVLFFDRDTRQQALHEDVRKAIEEVWGPQPSKPSPADSKDKYIEIGPPRQPIARIWMNASFQRISIYRPVFDEHSEVLSPEGRQLFLALSQAIGRHATDLSYVFIQGIVEKAEFALVSKDGLADVERTLSQDRADEVFKLLKSAGFVANDQESLKPNQFLARFVIPLGTGSTLYTSGAPIGRVDFLLFYADASSQAFGARYTKG